MARSRPTTIKGVITKFQLMADLALAPRHFKRLSYSFAMDRLFIACHNYC